MMRSLMIGVDVGGTFTDVFVLDEATGKTRLAKVPTSRPDQSGGFLAGIAAQVADFGRIASVVHGTTAGTNALLEPRDLRLEVALRGQGLGGEFLIVQSNGGADTAALAALMPAHHDAGQAQMDAAGVAFQAREAAAIFRRSFRWCRGWGAYRSPPRICCGCARFWHAAILPPGLGATAWWMRCRPRISWWKR